MFWINEKDAGNGQKIGVRVTSFGGVLKRFGKNFEGLGQKFEPELS